MHDYTLEKGEYLNHTFLPNGKEGAIDHGELFLHDLEDGVQVVGVVELEVAAEGLHQVMREHADEVLLLLVSEGVAAGADRLAHYPQQAHRLCPHHVEGLRLIEQVEEVVHQRGQEALIAEHVPEEGRQVDVTREACDAVPRIVVGLKLVQTQRKRVHEDRLQLPQGQQDDRPEVFWRAHSEQRLEVLNAHLQEVADVGVPEDVDVPAVLVVHLRAVLHGDVLEHRHEDPHQQAVPL